MLEYRANTHKTAHQWAKDEQVKQSGGALELEWGHDCVNLIYRASPRVFAHFFFFLNGQKHFCVQKKQQNTITDPDTAFHIHVDVMSSLINYNQTVTWFTTKKKNSLAWSWYFLLVLIRKSNLYFILFFKMYHQQKDEVQWITERIIYLPANVTRVLLL